MGVVYKILNTVTGKYYIGSTNNLHKRKIRHLRDLRNEKHHNIYLQRSFNIHGENSFIFVIIAKCENYKEVEQNHLDNMDINEVYNISITSSGGDFISNHPDRERLIREATERLLKYPPSKPKYGEENPNWRGGISNKKCKCGNRMEPKSKTCHKCVDRRGSKNSFYNKTHTEEVRKKISEANKGRANESQEKIVIGNGIEYRSLSECARQIGVTPNAILYRIRSKNFPEFYYK